MKLTVAQIAARDQAAYVAAQARWRRVYDELAERGVPMTSGRGNEILLDLETWEIVARLLPALDGHQL